MRKKRYRVKVYTNMRNPFGVVFAGFQKSMTYDLKDRREANLLIKRMNAIYPYGWKYRIKKVWK